MTTSQPKDDFISQPHNNLNLNLRMWLTLVGPFPFYANDKVTLIKIPPIYNKSTFDDSVTPYS